MPNDTTPGDEVVAFPKQTGQFIDLGLIQAQQAQTNREFINHLGQQALADSLFYTNALRTATLREAGLITDDMLNPVVNGAGNVLTGQAPVNSQLASTASLASVFGQITAEDLATFLAVAQAIQNAKQGTPAA